MTVEGPDEASPRLALLFRALSLSHLPRRMPANNRRRRLEPSSAGKPGMPGPWKVTCRYPPGAASCNPRI